MRDERRNGPRAQPWIPPLAGPPAGGAGRPPAGTSHEVRDLVRAVATMRPPVPADPGRIAAAMAAAVGGVAAAGRPETAVVEDYVEAELGAMLAAMTDRIGLYTGGDDDCASAIASAVVRGNVKASAGLGGSAALERNRRRAGAWAEAWIAMGSPTAATRGPLREPSRMLGLAGEELVDHVSALLRGAEPRTGGMLAHHGDPWSIGEPRFIPLPWKDPGKGTTTAGGVPAGDKSPLLYEHLDPVMIGKHQVRRIRKGDVELFHAEDVSAALEARYPTQAAATARVKLDAMMPGSYLFVPYENAALKVRDTPFLDLRGLVLTVSRSHGANVKGSPVQALMRQFLNVVVARRRDPAMVVDAALKAVQPLVEMQARAVRIADMRTERAMLESDAMAARMAAGEDEADRTTESMVAMSVELTRVKAELAAIGIQLSSEKDKAAKAEAQAVRNKARANRLEAELAAAVASSGRTIRDQAGRIDVAETRAASLQERLDGIADMARQDGRKRGARTDDGEG